MMITAFLSSFVFICDYVVSRTVHCRHIQLDCHRIKDSTSLACGRTQHLRQGVRIWCQVVELRMVAHISHMVLLPACNYQKTVKHLLIQEGRFVLKVEQAAQLDEEVVDISKEMVEEDLKSCHHYHDH